MKTSFHSLIPFLPLFCNCQFRRLDSVQFFCSQAHILTGWRPETHIFTSESTATTWLLLLTVSLCNTSARTPRKTQPVNKACLPRCCLAVDVVLSLAGICLPSRCLAMCLHITILSIVLFLPYTQRFGDWILSPFSGKNFLSWVQTTELVPFSRHQYQHNLWYIN
jgi:hypothetical protein